MVVHICAKIAVTGFDYPANSKIEASFRRSSDCRGDARPLVHLLFLFHDQMII